MKFHGTLLQFRDTLLKFHGILKCRGTLVGNPCLKPDGNYMSQLFEQPLTLYFVFKVSVRFSL
jgi:hypothetical protein